MDGSRLHLPVGRQDEQAERAERALARSVARECLEFLEPLLRELGQRIDVRLVRVLAITGMAMRGTASAFGSPKGLFRPFS